MGDTRLLTAEAVGTFILMIGGPGTAILAVDAVGAGGVAAAFGISLLIAAYAIGPISGCHINPAVTLGLVANGSLEAAKAPFYVIGQLIGAVIGGGLLLWLSEISDQGDKTGILATNQWGESGGVAGLGGLGIPAGVLTRQLVLMFVL